MFLLQPLRIKSLLPPEQGPRATLLASARGPDLLPRTPTSASVSRTE